MLELFGSDYVAEHCINALKKENENKLLKIYITDGIKGLIDCITAIGGAQTDMPRWIDWIKPREDKPERKPEDIISSIKDTLKRYGGETDGIDAVRPDGENNA